VQSAGREHLVMPRLPLLAYLCASSVVDLAERTELGFEITAEDDVRATARHVGCDRYRARAASLRNYVRLTLVLFCGQDLVMNLLLLQQAGNKVTPPDLDGDAECIAVDLATGERLGASDARNESGRAVGY